MTYFFAFQSMEFKRITGKRNLIIILCTFIILLAAANQGINERKKIPGKIQKFIRIQKRYFENATNYDGYGRDGITMLHVPSANRVICRNTPIPSDLTARVDSVVTLRIKNNMKGKSLIARLFFGRIDVVLVVLIVFTLLAMFYGSESFHTREYLKFLASIISHARIFWALLFSRFLSFILGFIVLAAGLMMFIQTRGVRFTTLDYNGLLILLLAALGMMLHLALLTKKSIYIFDNFVQGIPNNMRWELAKMLEQGISNDTVVIDMVSNDARWLDHDDMITIIYKNGKYEKIPKSK